MVDSALGRPPGVPFGCRARLLDHPPGFSEAACVCRAVHCRVATGLEILLAAIPQWRPEYHGVLRDDGFWPTTASPAERFDDRGELTAAADQGVEVFDPDPDDQARSYRAPDGSHIMKLGQEAGGGLALCTLAPGESSTPVRHRSVEELWYVLAGEGQISRRQGLHDPWVYDLMPGTSVDVGTGLTFQFRATGALPLRLLILTLPHWPGPDEAIPSRRPPPGNSTGHPC
jgi:mannose-6-phosphate isomerase-like protein (cupin superfamily)